ncbi:MAG: TRAP transporter large permease subunit [Desulfarculaceae bacterium]|jgi:tripartite ATP-independent transporter DctM subunit
MESIALTSVVLGIIFFVLLGAGVWIGLTLLLVAGIGIHFFTPIPAGKVLATITWNTLDSWPLSCLPLFIFMGELLFRTRISRNLFEGMAPWVRWLPGRLLHANVLGCALFAAISGSSAATCATMAKVTLPEFERLGYDRKLAVGSLAGSGTLGFLIPPSIVMVIYGVLADVSIGKLFMAGIMPGLLAAGLYMGYMALRGSLNPAITPSENTSQTMAERLRLLPKVLPVIGLIALVLGTIYSGWATPTEASAIGVLGALLLGIFTGALTKKSFAESLMGATKTTVMMGLIVMGASYFSTAMGYLGIPRSLAMYVASLKLSPYALIAALTVFYIFLGCFLDGGSIIVITLPICLPLVTAAGFSPIWFGIYLVIMAELCQITPPVGFNLFVLQKETGREISFIVRAAAPFFLLLLLALAFITVFPGIALWLPSRMF